MKIEESTEKFVKVLPSQLKIQRSTEELVDLLKFYLRGLVAEIDMFAESVKEYANCISHVISEIKEKNR